jgi:hypothetical protein
MVLVKYKSIQRGNYEEGNEGEAGGMKIYQLSKHEVITD